MITADAVCRCFQKPHRRRVCPDCRLCQTCGSPVLALVVEQYAEWAGGKGKRAEKWQQVLAACKACRDQPPAAVASGGE